jgi:cobalt/nickel transport system permease protein
MSKLQRKIWFWLGLLLIACPLGLILPDLFKAGDAWGEWDKKTIQENAGFVPKGMDKNAEIWKAPITDYTLNEKSTLPVKSFHYMLSGFVGIAIIGGLTLIITRILHRNE